MKRFGLKPVEIHGCTLGHRGVHGGLLHKPWRLCSNSPFIHEIFQDSKCPGTGEHAKHESCTGSNAPRSALYSPDMCKKAHSAFDERIKPRCIKLPLKSGAAWIERIKKEDPLLGRRWERNLE